MMKSENFTTKTTEPTENHNQKKRCMETEENSEKNEVEWKIRERINKGIKITSFSKRNLWQRHLQVLKYMKNYSQEKVSRCSPFPLREDQEDITNFKL